MSSSRGSRLLLLTALTAVAFDSPAGAQLAALSIGETTFEKFAKALGPIPFEKQYQLICNSKARGEVKDFDFTILPTAITVKGQVSGKWCGLSIGGTVQSTAIAQVVSEGRALRVRVLATSYRPRVKTFLGWITIPVDIDIGSPLSPNQDIPLGAASFELFSASGTHKLRVYGDNLSVVHVNRRLELIGDARLQ
jgi:hypothetical protein